MRSRGLKTSFGGFLGLEVGTDQDVYEHDIHECVRNADLIIAECSFPSLGLGWELGTAVEKYRKPVLAVAKEGTKVTRLVTGAQSERNPDYQFELYRSVEDLLSIAVTMVMSIFDRRYAEA
jgi:hypothetical protein